VTALTDTLELLTRRHETIVLTFDLETRPDVQAEWAREALDGLGIDHAAASLTDDNLPSVRLALDVMAWRWVEARAALGFDFSADGGSYSRSQLARQAAEMRRKAEDRAAAAGLSGYGWPDAEMTTPVNDLLSDEWREVSDVGLYPW
jgi:hypothetical protein